MGRRILRLSNTFLSIPFGDGEHHFEITQGALPADTRVIDVRMDFNFGSPHELILLLESSEWEPNREGDAYPEHKMMFTTLYPKEGDFVSFSEVVPA